MACNVYSGRSRYLAVGAGDIAAAAVSPSIILSISSVLGAAGDVSLERAAHGAPAPAHVPAACARLLRGVHALLGGSPEATTVGL